MTNKSITKQEMEYWLEDNYTNWLPDVLRNMINENKPDALINLKKEIKKANQDSKDAQWQQQINRWKETKWPIELNLIKQCVEGVMV